MESIYYFLIGFILVIGYLIAISGIKVVPVGFVYVVERLGAFHKILEPGLHFIIPIQDKIAHKTPMIEQTIVVNHNGQEVKLKFMVNDVKLYIYGVKSFLEAFTNLIVEAIDYNEIENLSYLQESAQSLGIKVNKILIK